MAISYRGIGRWVFLVLLFGASFLTSGCGNLEAAPATYSQDAVMQAIRDYGQGHQGTRRPPPANIPDEPDQMYSSKIRVLIYQEDFSQLEKIAQINRVERGVLLAGTWKSNAFYEGTSYPNHSDDLKDSDFTPLGEILKRWVAAYPQSGTAHIAMADFYSYYGGLARGSEFAKDVSRSRWKLFRLRTAQAKEQLMLASHLKDRDPSWFESMQLVAHDEGWERADARALLDAAVAFEPSYYHYYREYATYLLPQWYGEPGEIEAFGAEVASRVPEPEGAILYFRINSSLSCYCRQALVDLQGISYPKYKEGYEELNRLYGVSNLNANRFGFVAYMRQDKPGTQEAMQAITRKESDIWYQQGVFESAKEWVASP